MPEEEIPGEVETGRREKRQISGRQIIFVIAAIAIISSFVYNFFNPRPIEPATVPIPLNLEKYMIMGTLPNGVRFIESEAYLVYSMKYNEKSTTLKVTYNYGSKKIVAEFNDAPKMAWDEIAAHYSDGKSSLDDRVYKGLDYDGYGTPTYSYFWWHNDIAIKINSVEDSPELIELTRFFMSQFPPTDGLG